MGLDASDRPGVEQRRSRGVSAGVERQPGQQVVVALQKPAVPLLHHLAGHGVVGGEDRVDGPQRQGGAGAQAVVGGRQPLELQQGQGDRPTHQGGGQQQPRRRPAGVPPAPREAADGQQGAQGGKGEECRRGGGQRRLPPGPAPRPDPGAHPPQPGCRVTPRQQREGPGGRQQPRPGESPAQASISLRKSEQHLDGSSRRWLRYADAEQQRGRQFLVFGLLQHSEGHRQEHEGGRGIGYPHAEDSGSGHEAEYQSAAWRASERSHHRQCDSAMGAAFLQCRRQNETSEQQQYQRVAVRLRDLHRREHAEQGEQPQRQERGGRDGNRFEHPPGTQMAVMPSVIAASFEKPALDMRYAASSATSGPPHNEIRFVALVSVVVDSLMAAQDANGGRATQVGVQWMTQSLYWYDLETSGTEPRWDRIVQFGGFRTDMDLNPLGDEYCTYVRLPDDVLPNPEATLVTGITPALTHREGISEFEMLDRVRELFSQPKTCVAGFNSLRFDTSENNLKLP